MGSVRYTKEEKLFLKKYIPGHKVDSIIAEFKKRFGRVLTERAVSSYKSNYKISSGTRRGKPVGYSKIFTAEIIEAIKSVQYGKKAKDVAVLVNERMGTDLTERQIKAFRQRWKVDSGLTGQFQKGWPNPHKGDHDYRIPNGEKYRFQKGEIPKTRMDVGAERTDDEGRVIVKVMMPDVWQYKHIVEWEKARGRIPEGKVLIFLDSDKTNWHIENLACVSRAEAMALSNRKMRSSNRDVTLCGLGILRLKNRIKALGC